MSYIDRPTMVRFHALPSLYFWNTLARYVFTPELLPLVLPLCSTLPLVLALWLMTTPEDRALLLHPHKFRTESMSLQLAETETEARLRAERERMGINLQ